MKLKYLEDEDFVNYKKPSMLLGFPKCSFKCEKDCGKKICQNRSLINEKDININTESIIDRYINNPYTDAIICGGLEPFDSYHDLIDLIIKFRKKCNDDIVIYSGYTEQEIEYLINNTIDTYDNIIIKFGRYIPDQESHYDEVLGIYLSSPNQYAKKVS